MREDHPEWSRLVIGAREEVRTLLDLCRDWEGPFWLLRVLVVSRIGKPEGRYQSSPLSFAEVERFALTYQEYLEQDARHHLWVKSVAEEGLLILDRHRLIYAYDDLEAQVERLRRAGFSEGEAPVPFPHAHHYHDAFDAAEAAVFEHLALSHHPLQPIDED